MSARALREEPIRFGREPWILPGTLTVNEERPVLAGVVLVHGSGPHDRDESVGALKPFRDLAWGLAAHGIAVLRYEKRTRCHRLLCARESEFTVRHETIDDAIRAIEVMRSDERIGDRVVVLGHSLGGMLAPRIAVDAGGVGGIVMLAPPARPLPLVILDQVQYLGALEPALITPALIAFVRLQVLNAMGETSLAEENRVPPLLGMPMAYWRDLRAYDATTAVLSLRVPVLILHGDRDFQVTSKDIEPWRRVAQCNNVEIRECAGLNHFFVPSVGIGSFSEYEYPGCMARDVLADIARWVTRLYEP